MNVFLWQNGVEVGPYDLQSIESSLRDGSVSPKVLARLESTKEWKQLETLLPKKASGVEPPLLPSASKKQQSHALSYVLTAVGLLLLMFGCSKRNPDRLEAIADDLARKELAWSNESKNLGAFIVANAKVEELAGSAQSSKNLTLQAKGELAEAQHHLDSSDRHKADADRLREQRERTMFMCFGLGVFVLVAGLILRVL